MPADLIARAKRALNVDQGSANQIADIGVFERLTYHVERDLSFADGGHRQTGSIDRN